MNLFFAGDTHGSLDHLADVPADAVVIHVGDMSPLGGPLEQALPEQVHDRFFWIPGNHDYDSVEDFENAFTGFGKACCFDRKVIQVGDLRVAGLGGVFSQKTWWPNDSVTASDWTRKSRLQATPRQERFRGGLSVRQRKYIFREDFDRLSTLRANVLVTHEAPKARIQQRGFFAINELARLMGAHTIVHGHHHIDYVSETDAGIKVIGVGLRGLTDLHGNIYRAGEQEYRR